jgi:methyltransferase (TIGR00027 family)
MRTQKPSKTARKVALNVITLGARHEMEGILPPGIADATAKLLVESGVAGSWAVKFSRSKTAIGIYLAFDWMMPGQFEAFAHRKAFIERQVRKCIEAGASQVLVLGAGYDTLGWRLAPEFSGVDFFEIDHPATARLKAKGITAMGKPVNLHLVAEDLGQRQLVDVLLSDNIWSPNAKTVIVAEGLLMYLPPEAVGVLFEQCAAVTGADSQFVFTYIGSLPNGTPDAGPWTKMVMWLLNAAGEPWLWSIVPADLGAFLNKHHWSSASDLVSSSDKYGIEFHGIAVK